MKTTDFIRELGYPVTNSTIVIGVLFFWALTWLAGRAGILGVGLAIVIVPAWFRYLVSLLEERANGRHAPVASIETFSFWDNTWALTPMVLTALLLWTGIWLGELGYGSASWLIGIVAVFVLPASLGILAVTHSPFESLNPAAIGRLIRACGVAYFMIPVILILLSLVFEILGRFGLPRFVTELADSYLFVLLFTLTGALLYDKGIAGEVRLDVPVVDVEREAIDELVRERQRVANHAYGFISRGNREGGFVHILEQVGSEPDASEAATWFFNEMMRWESKDAALFYAQTCLSHFLFHDEDQRALKLMSSCLHQDPSWKPSPEDRGHAVALAKRYGRQDLVRLLRG